MGTDTAALYFCETRGLGEASKQKVDVVRCRGNVETSIRYLWGRYSYCRPICEEKERGFVAGTVQKRGRFARRRIVRRL